MDSPQSKEARWFSEEVVPHEPSLRAYLRASFPSVRDVDDVVQTSFLRLWRQRAAEPIHSARAFLFTVARRLAIDALRHHRRSPVHAVDDLSRLPVMAEGPSGHAAASRAERVQLLADAIDALPARCREVLILRKLKFLPQREVAARLGISENGVEVQLTRALARCRAHLQKRGVDACFADEA